MPADDERSNFRLVEEALLSRLAQPPSLVHRIPVELGHDAAAAAYDESLRGVPLGLVLLGIGPDGHTASLSPTRRRSPSPIDSPSRPCAASTRESIA